MRNAHAQCGVVRMHPAVSVANVRTPFLNRAVTDYTQVLGFHCQQQVPSVFARLTHGPLCVHLWAYGATPGRWERPAPDRAAFVPAHHCVEVSGIHALYASLLQVVSRPCRTGLAGSRLLHADRLDPEGVVWKPWKAWETTLTDIDGNVLHLLDRAFLRPGTRPLPGVSSKVSE